MKLSELNESAKFNYNFENGIIVYLDKDNKTFNFADKNQIKNRGLTYTIKSENDYKKLRKTYKINILHDDFITMSNNYKKNTESRKRSKSATKMDQEMSKALAAMQKDIIKMTKKK